MINPLDAIMDWYQAAYDSIRITRRVIEQDVPGIMTDRHVFFQASLPERQQKLDDAIAELRNVVVLALVAVFERTLREHVMDLVRNSNLTGNPIRDKIREGLEKDVEYWHFSERLVDAFETVPATDRGNVKELIKFRNWVAHGHFLATAAPTRTEPNQAYRRLTDFLQIANLIS